MADPNRIDAKCGCAFIRLYKADATPLWWQVIACPEHVPLQVQPAAELLEWAAGSE